MNVGPGHPQNRWGPLVALCWLLASGCQTPLEAPAAGRGLGKAAAVRHSRCPLSPLGQAIFDAALTADPDEYFVPVDRLLSFSNHAGAALVGSPTVFSAMSDLIAEAQRDIALATFAWHSDSTPEKTIFDGLVRLQERLSGEGRVGDPVVVRNSSTRTHFSSGTGPRFESQKASPTSAWTRAWSI